MKHAKKSLGRSGSQDRQTVVHAQLTTTGRYSAECGQERAWSHDRVIIKAVATEDVVARFGKHVPARSASFALAGREHVDKL